MMILLGVIGIFVWMFFDELHKIRIRNAQAQQAAQMARLAKEQATQAKEQARLRREQERQAVQLQRHEEQLAKLEFRMEQAEADIAHWNEQLSALYTMLDYERMEQDACVAGGKEYVKHQKKIIMLTNQIHTAETKLSKAEFNKAQAEQRLNA